jgi:hypothetical protein
MRRPPISHTPTLGGLRNSVKIADALPCRSDGMPAVVAPLGKQGIGEVLDWRCRPRGWLS